jgi:hypothetical protein
MDMSFARGLIIAGAVLLSGLIIWAGLSAPFWASFAAITAMPWGVVTLVDLYLGFICAAILVVILEQNRVAVLLIIALIFVLGNVVTALWLAWRGIPRLLSLTLGRQTQVSS